MTPWGRYTQVLLSSNEFLFIELTTCRRHTSARAHPVTRREALCRMGNGFGMLAFASLVGESLRAPPALAIHGGRHDRASSIIRRARSASSSCS